MRELWRMPAFRCDWQRAATLGRYQIEAAISAVHGARRHGHPADWAAIAGLYRGLVALYPTTGALTGLAVACEGIADPVSGLTILETADAPRAAAYQPLWAVRAQRGQAAPLGRAGSRPRIVPSASSTC